LKKSNLRRRILQHKPIFDISDSHTIKKIIENGWISEGPETKKFENIYRKFVGTRYAIATTSGTAAIFLSLKGCGIKAGDEVIVPNITFVATASAVKLAGANPVLAEINEDDFTISLSSIRKKITKRTKAIIPVHINGRTTQLDELQEISREFNLRIIEDASQGLGSKYKNRYLGSIGDVAAFSLAPTKIITTGQGGIITTNNFRIYDLIRRIKDQGRYDKRDCHPIVGYNFKFTDIQAALGNSQFSKLNSRLIKMNKIFNKYREMLSKNKFIKIPKKRSETQLWYFDILAKKRNKLIKFLSQTGIVVIPFHKPLSCHPPFRTKNKFPISQKIGNEGLYLPSHSDLTLNDVDYVSEKINNFIF